MLDPDDEQVVKDAKDGGAVLVTFDRVLRAAAGGMTPYEALEQAKLSGKGKPEAQAEVSRLHALKPRELTVMVKAGNKIYRKFQKYIKVTKQEAELTRQIRAVNDYSWRAVARFWSSRWTAPWGGNQLAGMVICEKAAKALGEDFLAPPWN